MMMVSQPQKLLDVEGDNQMLREQCCQSLYCEAVYSLWLDYILNKWDGLNQLEMQPLRFVDECNVDGVTLLFVSMFSMWWINDSIVIG